MSKKIEKGVFEIIRESGHNLHSHVIDHLEKLDFNTEISPYYIDTHTDKPREVDLVARKNIPIFSDSNQHNLQLVLSIDCKYIKTPTVFWFFNNKKLERSLKVLNINIKEVIKLEGATSFHFLTTDKVARLFQSGFTEKEPVNDLIYKACSQAISGSIFAREHSGTTEGIIYPVVVVDGPGKLYSANDPEQELESIILHVDYSYYPDRQPDKKPIREPFYVIIVRKEHLKDTLKLLSIEVEKIRSYKELMLNY